MVFHRVATYAGALALAGALIAYAAWPQGMQRATVPGAINPQVTQANIDQTICVRGWSAAHRPPIEVTEAIKRNLVPRGSRLSDWQLDHAISLEIGGASLDPSNLWVQPIHEAHIKDGLENALHELVCKHEMPLQEAQQCIARDWVACYERIMK